MNWFVRILLLLLVGLPLHAAENKSPPLATPKPPTYEAIEPAAPIRKLRPIAISVSGVGKTPFAGILLDANLHPYLSLGVGYGYFSVGSASGSFIPVYLQGYFLKSNFSPFIEAGADFVTVKFDSTSVLLDSTFHGTQVIVGGGFEYRFDFGLVLRLDAVRYINAAIWSPGASVGYAFAFE
jgi:hypothetical protein